MILGYHPIGTPKLVGGFKHFFPIIYGKTMKNNGFIVI
jgi:hypothetical protein